MEPQGTLIVNTKEKGVALGDLFGIFFEDLNHAADGGLYAELVQNRSFEFDPIDNPSYHPLTAWEKVQRGGGRAEIYVEDIYPLNDKNSNYLVIDVIEPGDGVGVMNLGYNSGIPVKEKEQYIFSFYARIDSPASCSVRIALEGADGTYYADANIEINSKQWKKYEIDLVANSTDYSGRLVITTQNLGKLYLDMVSLFPKETFKNRPNGMRKDIAEMIADLKPKFMRFPGGCLVHDGSLSSDDRDSMYRWKNTIGNIEVRPPRRNNWRYNQSLGLGFFELFQFCEDIGAKPIPVLPAGYDPHHQRIVPIEELQPWIDDALDLIEFANGDVTTPWGSKRAHFGHPEPFGLEYIAIGNEEVGEPFFERYTYFHKAIKEKYPEIKIINTSGPFAAGGEYERGWKSARENGSDFVDEHYYQAPEWFLANYNRYNDFKEEDPKVFLGEYASWGNTYYNALVEAAFMTGLEKNAHAVGLACYAPMLCNVDYVNWKPNLIWFNNQTVYGTQNYYVQKLFMNHQGDNLLSVQAKGLPKAKKYKDAPITGEIGLTTSQTSAKYYDISLVNMDTGEEKRYEDCIVDADSPMIVLDSIDWSNYKFSLKAKKLSGIRGFNIIFGKKNDNNYLNWEVGGWQNQDVMVCSITNGRNSCLTQSLLTVETDKEYELELVVRGRKICTYINDELINETEDKLPIIEPLYYSASIENISGDVIIKVVNVQEESVRAQIMLDGVEQKVYKGCIYELAGYELDDENSIDSPELIVPKESEFSFKGQGYDYEFPNHSITVFRIHTRLR